MDRNYFPRGGAKEKPVIQYKKFVFEKKNISKSNKRRGYKAQNKDEQEFIKLPKVRTLVHYHLKLNDIKPGFQTICSVSGIYEDFILVILPQSGARAYLLKSDMSNSFSSLPSDHTASIDLSRMFYRGQVLSCKVINRTNTPNVNIQKPFPFISIKPGVINAKLNSGMISKHCRLQMAVSSVEDHGYMMESGIPGVMAFLPLKQAKKYTHKFYGRSETLCVGTVVWCYVVKSSVNANGMNIVEVILPDDNISKFENNNSSNLWPGCKVHTTIMKVLSHGCCTVLVDGTEVEGIVDYKIDFAKDPSSHYLEGSNCAATVVSYHPGYNFYNFSFSHDVMLAFKSKSDYFSSKTFKATIDHIDTVIHLDIIDKEFKGIASTNPHQPDNSETSNTIYKSGDIVQIKILSFDTFRRKYSCQILSRSQNEEKVNKKHSKTPKCLQNDFKSVSIREEDIDSSYENREDSGVETEILSKNKKSKNKNKKSKMKPVPDDSGANEDQGGYCYQNDSDIEIDEFLTDEDIEDELLSDMEIKDELLSDDEIKEELLSNDEIKEELLSEDEIKEEILSDDEIKKELFSDTEIKVELLSDNENEQNQNIKIQLKKQKRKEIDLMEINHCNKYGSIAEIKGQSNDSNIEVKGKKEKIKHENSVLENTNSLINNKRKKSIDFDSGVCKKIKSSVSIESSSDCCKLKLSDVIKKKMEDASLLSLQEADAHFLWDATPEDLVKITSKNVEDFAEELDEENVFKKSSTKSQRKASELEKEKQIQDKEEELLKAFEEPKSADHYERIILSRPDDSRIWIKYMAFHLEATEIEKAKSVGSRALKLISHRNEQDRLNIWLALLNLEHLYGSKDVFKETWSEALKCNDDYTVNCKVLDLYASSQNTIELNNLVQKMIKQYRENNECWYLCLSALMSAKMEEKARDLLQRGLKTLPAKTHVTLISRFALLENSHGHDDEAQALFDNLLTSYPARVDIWFVYLDMLIKSNQMDLARQVFERATSMKLPAKKMKSIFKKWLDFEEKHGNIELIEMVRNLAIRYVEQATKNIKT